MKYRFNLILTFIALGGFFFCLLSAFGITEALCLTQGCEVYQGYKVAGLSFYWMGAAVFLILGLMSLWPGAYSILAILTGLVLVGDFVFLIIQFLFWPCTSCLIVAALLGSFAWILSGHVKSGLRILCIIWLLLFSANIFLLAKDSIPPWPVFGQNNAEIQVFFSPTCPACRQVVESFMLYPDSKTHVAFYPLAKDVNDYQRVALLVQNLKQGMPAEQAFASHWKPLFPQEKPGQKWNLAFNLWRNQLNLAKKGATQVPLILSRVTLGNNSDDILPSLNGCSIFFPGAEGCKNEPALDPFKSVFK